ncbi:spore germination protein [Clostridium sp. MSJ-11]|uniref:Spore germination protein n=1 Tax=Clostridium mobile TaxID=2841512 RepID=A0ABS6ELQ5_9CLOT|nr:spore germination protein [Clostridium mobile]MBU5486152.1 spore germination protein [Clostridium mobile]
MKEVIKDNISKNLDENIQYLKELLKGNSDIVFREFYINDTKALLMYIDGMGDKVLLNNFVLETLMFNWKELEIEEIKDKILTVTDLKELEKLSEGVNGVLSGDTMLLIHGMKTCYVIASRFWPTRGVTEPSRETVIRGGRDGFTETIRFNTALVRRRIRDTRLKVVPKTLGTRSKSDVAIMYIEDIAENHIVKDVLDRMEKIDIDAVLDSGYVEQLIEDNKWSIFPQTQNTERPDVVAAALYEGRVAILVDNSPFAIVVPATLPNLFQSPDDYYQRWVYGTVLRFIRFLSLIISIILPGMYVATTSFHPSIIPTQLAFFVAASREGVPFPAFMEAIIMEVSLALLTEAVIRLPKAIGATIGIVGGLIIGQAAVSAGIVSPIMIIIVSLTTITSFTTPSYEITSAFRIIRFLLIISASIMGLYGVVICLLMVLTHLIRLKSFGVPYLSPFVNINKKDFKDMIIRFPLRFIKERPEYMGTKDKIRQK